MTSPLEVYNVFGAVPGQAVYSNTHAVVRTGGLAHSNQKNQKCNFRSCVCVPKDGTGENLLPTFSFWSPRDVSLMIMCVPSVTHRIPHWVE